MVVSARQERNGLLVIVGNLGWPLLLGGAASVIFYTLLYRGPLNTPQMHRYFSSHPVLICETIFFFVGLASLLLKVFEVLGQHVALGVVRLEERPASGQKPGEAVRLLEAIGQLPAAARNSYLGRRLRDALQFVARRGSADGLEDELKYLADMDAARQQDSYALVRIVIWATPMLGFLGTVVGITQALGDLDPQLLATDIQKAMEGLLAGLYVAFDTTALALTLSMTLMFIQFLIDRVETHLLGSVDLRTNEALVGRFEHLGGSADPHVASVERMGQAVLQTLGDVVQQQVTLWQGTIQAAHEQWSQLVETAGQQLRGSLTAALDQSLQKHAAEMDRQDRESADRVRTRWEQLQTALSDNARMMKTQQQEMNRQSELLLQVVHATGDVVQLEQALNANLATLAGAKNFEDTVMSLSAAIHLLTTRINGPPDSTAVVDLKHAQSRGRAA